MSSKCFRIWMNQGDDSRSLARRHGRDQRLGLARQSFRSCQRSVADRCVFVAGDRTGRTGRSGGSEDPRVAALFSLGKLHGRAGSRQRGFLGGQLRPHVRSRLRGAWIHSERDRPVTLRLQIAAFAGNIGLTVWLNGRQVYAGLITGEPGKGKVRCPPRSAGARIAWSSSATTARGCDGVRRRAGCGPDDLSDVRIDAAPTSKSEKEP